MPSHSDTETCIREDSHIVTVSLGATRTLLFKDITTGKDIASIKLSHGDMSVMSKESQKHYRHEILPEPECIDGRVSITFRLVKPEAPPMCSQSISREDLTDIPKECGYVPYGNQSDCSVRDTVSRNLTREHSHQDHSQKTLSAQKQPINSYHACLSHCRN